jgi:hypothetical protein
MSGTLARHDENRFKPDRSWRPVRFIFKGVVMSGALPRHRKTTRIWCTRDSSRNTSRKNPLYTKSL